MASERVEAAARALWAASCDHRRTPVYPFDRLIGITKTELYAYAEAALAAADEAEPMVSASEVERLRTVENAARWVRHNWDREDTQHLSMPALREALDGHPGAPTRAEVLAAHIVEENTALLERTERAERAARDFAEALDRIQVAVHRYEMSEGRPYWDDLLAARAKAVLVIAAHPEYAAGR